MSLRRRYHCSSCMEAMGVDADDDCVLIGFVNEDGALVGAGFVADVEPEFVAGVELPSVLVFLELEAQDVAELVSAWVDCVDVVGWADHLERCPIGD